MFSASRETLRDSFAVQKSLRVAGRTLFEHPLCCMDVHDRLVSREDDVGPTRQVLAMEREPVACSMGDASDLKLRSRMLCPNAGHQDRALFPSEPVRHDKPPENLRPRYDISHPPEGIRRRQT